jgi:hypothetical protein
LHRTCRHPQFDAGDLLALDRYVEFVVFALVVLLSLGAGVAASRVVMGLLLFTMRQLRAKIPSGGPLKATVTS